MHFGMCRPKGVKKVISGFNDTLKEHDYNFESVTGDLANMYTNLDHDSIRTAVRWVLYMKLKSVALGIGGVSRYLFRNLIILCVMGTPSQLMVLGLISRTMNFWKLFALILITLSLLSVILWENRLAASQWGALSVQHLRPPLSILCHRLQILIVLLAPGYTADSSSCSRSS